MIIVFIVNQSTYNLYSILRSFFSISLILLLFMASSTLKDYYATIFNQYYDIFFHILPFLPWDVVLHLIAHHVFIGNIFFLVAQNNNALHN